METVITFTSKVHKQHHSFVTTIPKQLVRNIDIHAGDLLAFDYGIESKICQIRIISKGVTYGIRSHRGRDRQDSGG
jgi:hypothetical protein